MGEAALLSRMLPVSKAAAASVNAQARDRR